MRRNGEWLSGGIWRFKRVELAEIIEAITALANKGGKQAGFPV
jgi:hypothetical protein